MFRSLDNAFPWPERRRNKVPLPPGMKWPDEEPEPRIQFIAGLSLGRVEGRATMALVQKTEASGSRLYHVARLDRWDANGGYDAVAADVQRLFALPPVQGGTLVIDAAAPPLVDLFRRGQYKPLAQVWPVCVTGGQDAALIRGAWNVPEAQLAANAAALVECGRLTFDAGLPFAAEMVQELRRFASRVGAGREAGWRQSDKDDINYALAVACWFGERCQKRLTFG